MSEPTLKDLSEKATSREWRVPDIPHDLPGSYELNIADYALAARLVNAFRNGQLVERAEVEAENAKLREEYEAAFREATHLAKSLHRQYFAETAPQWEPLNTAAGVITQIDNMTTLMRDLRAENAKLKAALDVVPAPIDQETVEWAEAETIAMLRADLSEALEGLRPFAKDAGGYAGPDDDFVTLYGNITKGHLRRAATIVAKSEGKTDADNL